MVRTDTIRMAVAAMAFAAGLMTTAANATVEQFTASGTGTNGPEGATATISISAGQLTVTLTSTQDNPTSAGQELSGIQISITGGAGSTISLSSVTGQLINIQAGGGVTNQSGTPDHWGAGISNSQIVLETVGTFGKGGQPNDLIIGNGPYTNAGGSITNTHEPHILDTATFVLTGSWITASTTVSGVTFLFGTSSNGDSQLVGTPVVTNVITPVPEPASLALLGVGLAGLGLARRRR